jgi:parallel beta-helix repeat protein
MKTNIPTLTLAAGVCLVAASNVFGSGGDIVPAGPPGRLFKTLDEIEPRTPISALPFDITQPGSYYLTTNLSLVGPPAGRNGINISASHVTLDLRGFALLGVAGSGNGVNVPAAPTYVTNLTIRNGTITGWGGLGVSAFTARNSQVLELRFSQNGNHGVSVGDGSLVNGCTARANGADGIRAESSCTVSGCSSSANLGDGINVWSGTTVSGCSSQGNTNDGIYCGTGCVISGNSVSANGTDGIQTSEDCRVSNNNCDQNGVNTATLGAGIYASGGDCSIENNNLTDNNYGLRIAFSGSVVANNTVRRNGTNYVIAPGNQLTLLLGQIPQSIDWPCRVVLAGSLSGASGQNGITVNTNDVTIDLAGHSLVGVAGSLDGIFVSGSRTNLTVRNGSVRGWASDGVSAGSAYNSQFLDLHAVNNTGYGLYVGYGCVVKTCKARANGAIGIYALSGCTIGDCAASENGTDGIYASTASTVLGCTAFNNVRNGISASSGSTVVNCTAYSNTNGISASSGSTVTTCTASGNATNGIVTVNGATVTGCTCRDNRTGILVGDDSRITDNACDNGTTGILVTGSDNRIDGNHVADPASTGISCTGTGNLIVRNTVSGAGTAYTIALGNNYGAILNSPGAGFAATNPWNNFAF